MAASGTHVFRVALRDRPSVRRDIEIGSAESLAKLAEAIVRAFDFLAREAARRNRAWRG